jgi:hypothetical protein
MKPATKTTVLRHMCGEDVAAVTMVGSTLHVKTSKDRVYEHSSGKKSAD